MKKTKLVKIGLYNPFLDTLGGGEKHIFLIINGLCEIFSEKKINVKVIFFWQKNILKKILERFDFSFIKNIEFFTPLNQLSTIETLKVLKQFDYFFYVTDGSYFFSTAKKNYIFSMIPDKKLYQMNFLNKLKLLNYQFISNSRYTSFWLNQWKIKNIVIEPYIEEKFYYQNEKKEKIILSVGRFFPHLHSKNQQKIINTFLNLKKTNKLFSSYQLVLAGGLKDEDKNYFKSLKKIVKNDQSIIFLPNIKTNKLINLYKKSKYFWHFTGLGVNENKNPEMVEHFGIAPFEAMVAGCLTFCHNSGGPKIILKNKFSEFLFNNEDDLIKKMIFIEKNLSLQNKLKNKAILMVKKNFNYKNFKNKISLIL